MAQELLTSTWEPENFYTAYLTADCTAGDTDIFLDIVPANSEGTLVIDPDSTTSREIIYYNSKTATKVTCPVNGRGYDNSAASAHTTGTKVIMAPIADWFNSLKTLFTTTPQGWSDLADIPDSVTYNGNRSYDLVFNSNDLTDTVSNGMRMKLTRTVTPPTQCTDLESGSSQYWSKSSPSGITFTDDFTCAAWVKLESYTGSVQVIIGRNTGTTDGWRFYINSSGQLEMISRRIAANNRSITSYQSIPLNKWVHVAATMDNSANSHTMYIDGVSVPFSTATNGTITALVQGAVDLVVGARSDGATDYFDGKIAQASVHSAVLTGDQIRAMASQTISSSTPSIVSGFTFNGAATDVTANANDLTANGGAGYATDSPMNATEYGIITANSFSTNTTLTVQAPEGYSIPTTGGVSAVSYSTQDVPYGFPRDRGKWTLQALSTSTANLTTSTTLTNSSNLYLTVPVGAWNLAYKFYAYAERNGGTAVDITGALGTTNNESNLLQESICRSESRSPSVPWKVGDTMSGSAERALTSQTTVYMLEGGLHTSGTYIINSGSSTQNQHYITAQLAYI